MLERMGALRDCIGYVPMTLILNLVRVSTSSHRAHIRILEVEEAVASGCRLGRRIRIQRGRIWTRSNHFC